jgi:hypothetical protein
VVWVQVLGPEQGKVLVRAQGLEQDVEQEQDMVLEQVSVPVPVREQGPA